MVIGLPERLTSTVAPASARPLDGGTGTNMSSQISTSTVRSRTSVAANSRSVPNGIRRRLPGDGDLRLALMPWPEANCRRS